MPYRQLEGYTRILHRLVPDLPRGDYSGLRKRVLSQPVDPYRDLRETNEPVSIAVDSTGISVHKAGGWATSHPSMGSLYARTSIEKLIEKMQANKAGLLSELKEVKLD